MLVGPTSSDVGRYDKKARHEPGPRNRKLSLWPNSYVANGADILYPQTLFSSILDYQMLQTSALQ